MCRMQSTLDILSDLKDHRSDGMETRNWLYLILKFSSQITLDTKSSADNLLLIISTHAYFKEDML